MFLVKDFILTFDISLILILTFDISLILIFGMKKGLS